MIEAVILYSTNDHRFFRPCIQNLLDAGVKTHVVAYSHMWNGHSENELIQKEAQLLFHTNPNYIHYSIDWHEGKTPSYWEALGRYLATKELTGEYVLYIDIDEIVEVEPFKKFLDEKLYTRYDAIKLANYWYFREPIYRAVQLEDSVVMCKTALAKTVPLQVGGRELYFRFQNQANMIGKESPFIHHYSWVRTKEEMMNKVKNWGHAADADWVPKVEKEFEHSFDGTDFVHGYSFETAPNRFNISI